MKYLLSFVICICFVFNLQAQTRSPKRGVSFNFTSDADLKALQFGTTWFYNWGTTPNNVTNSYNSIYGYEFCPMIWGGNWSSDAIRNYVKAHPDCKYILAFNEPNFKNQANLTPRQAADKWPDIKALASELGLKIISPACNYSSWAEYSSPDKWFDEFFRYVNINDVDGIAIHSYMGWASALDWYVNTYIEKYNKPLWLTEFCAWDDFTSNNGGTALQQRKEMIDMLDNLENNPMVAKYAWFIPRRTEVTNPSYPYMELLTNTKGTERGVLTETGMVWTYMSSYDKNFYHDVNTCIETEHYISKSKGIYMEQTTDEAGILNVYDFTSNRELAYNVDVPSAGTYTVRLRVLSGANSTVTVTSLKGTVSQTVASTGNTWETHEFQLALNAGKQQIAFKITSGNLKWNWFVITDNDANPDPMPNPEGPVVVTPPEGNNLALNKPIESSSAGTDLQRASLAVDGNAGTRWESKHGEDNKTLTIDLQTVAVLTDIVINWEGAYSLQYNIEVSTNGADWKQVFSTTSGSAGEERISLDGAPQARYVKINCIKRGTVYGFSIWEVEVYGHSPTRIPASEIQPFSVYPNPVTNTLFIQSEKPVDAAMLFDVNGRKLYEGEHVKFIDMSKYDAGIYILSIHLPEGEVINKKIVKN